MRRFLLSVAAGLLLLAACGDDDEGRPDLIVAAASDLYTALTEEQATFEEATGARITFVFGSSGQMRHQIAAGADYDVFLSADITFVEALAEDGDVLADTVTTYATGRIALAWREGIPPLAGVEDLTREDIARITIANPGHAPYGRAAEEALASAGVLQIVRPRMILGENVRQTTEYIRTGNADAGIVALPLVIHGSVRYIVIDASAHEPLIQGAAVVARTDAEAAARRFLDFLAGDDGQAILAGYGFDPP